MLFRVQLEPEIPHANAFQGPDETACTGNPSAGDWRYIMLSQNLMWIEKYRPRSIDDVVDQKETVEGIKALLKTPETMPHLLFSGPPGTGKSSMALCIARQLMGDNFRRLVLELNASDERGIGVVRERIKGFSQVIQTAPSGVQYGLVILDECDEMTRDAQTALRRIMETSSRTCRFILICNYQSGIIEPIQSRCSVFRFKQLEEKEALEYLGKVCKAENVVADQKVIARIFELSEGDLRRALNYLQVAATSSDSGKLDAAQLDKISPENDGETVRKMLKTALDGNFIKAREAMYELMGKRGVSGRDIIRTANREVVKMSELDTHKQIEAVRLLGEYDFRLSQGANEDIQLSAMLAQFSLLGSK
ncbi:MAG TPA: replication factor C small subunit [Candidatus Bathyarchaeia archaeon]|nr:replication factor C small subunit [Candidatus Bathyarchaeia archaeon]